MPTTITAKVSQPISQPELSRMWESERTTFNAGSGDGIDTRLRAPEMVLESAGDEVRLSFLSGGPDAEHKKLKAAFERAVRRYLPDIRIEWAA